MLYLAGFVSQHPKLLYIQDFKMLLALSLVLLMLSLIFSIYILSSMEKKWDQFPLMKNTEISLFDRSHRKKTYVSTTNNTLSSQIMSMVLTVFYLLIPEAGKSLISVEVEKLIVLFMVCSQFKCFQTTNRFHIQLVA